ncbi:MAG: hypothetical protein WBE58_02305 [Verrucomicrobiales bacterium]|nr:hypothetical protein [Verrucomicrobiales bacterium]
MFKRVILEDWSSLVPVIAFAVTAAVFIIILIRTLGMKRIEAERIARLPFEPNELPESHETSEGSDTLR